MTDEEKNLIPACGTFCHVTTQFKAELVKATGLDPSSDLSLVIRGQNRMQAVYLCPESMLDKVLNFIGDREKGEKELIVFKVAAVVLMEKCCGPDLGWLAAHCGGVELEAATVKTSLDVVGAIACYDMITPQEFSETVTSPNRHPTGPVDSSVDQRQWGTLRRPSRRLAHFRHGDTEPS